MSIVLQESKAKALDRQADDKQVILLIHPVCAEDKKRCGMGISLKNKGSLAQCLVFCSPTVHCDMFLNCCLSSNIKQHIDSEQLTSAISFLFWFPIWSQRQCQTSLGLFSPSSRLPGISENTKHDLTATSCIWLPFHWKYSILLFGFYKCTLKPFISSQSRYRVNCSLKTGGCLIQVISLLKWTFRSKTLTF